MVKSRSRSLEGKVETRQQSSYLLKNLHLSTKELPLDASPKRASVHFRKKLKAPQYHAGMRRVSHQHHLDINRNVHVGGGLALLIVLVRIVEEDGHTFHIFCSTFCPFWSTRCSTRLRHLRSILRRRPQNSWQSISIFRGFATLSSDCQS